jgi:uncharacterized membrane protein
MLDYLFTKTPLVFFVQNLWRDEAYSYLLGEKSIFTIIKLTVSDFSPPLYYILLHIWITLFGHSEIVLRSLSLIFFAGTVYILFEILVTNFKFSRLKAGLYLILILLNPFLAFYAFEARMYMMVTFFVTVAYYAFWNKKKKLYVVAMTCALYTHYFAAFILGIHLVETFLLNYSNSIKLKPFKIHFVLKKGEFSLKPILYSILLFTPWVLYFIFARNVSDGSFWIIQPPLQDLWYVPFVLFSGYERVFGEYYHDHAGYTAFHASLLQFLYVILFVPYLLYIYESFKNRHIHHKSTSFLKKISFLLERLTEFIESHRLPISLILWAFITPYVIFALSFIYQPYYLPRYFIFAVPGFLLLLIYCFDSLLMKKYIVFKVIGAVFLIYFVFLNQKFNNLNLKYRSKRNVSNMSNEIKAQLNDTDYVYVTSELDYHLYQYYISEDKVRIYGKTYEEIPQYVGKVLIPKDSVVSQYPVYPHRAFIIYYNWYKTKALY